MYYQFAYVESAANNEHFLSVTKNTPVSLID